MIDLQVYHTYSIEQDTFVLSIITSLVTVQYLVSTLDKIIVVLLLVSVLPEQKQQVTLKKHYFSSFNIHCLSRNVYLHYRLHVAGSLDDLQDAVSAS